MRVSFRLASASVLLLLAPSLDAQSATPANPALRSLFLVGDITPASSGSTSAAALASLFDTTRLNVVDRSIPGHSSRNVITTGAWAATLALVRPNDVVLIQFGAHEADPAAGNNLGTIPSAPGLAAESTLPGLSDDLRDTVNPATGQRELVHTFGWYLREMVVETIARGATPILCSPPASPNLGRYSDWSRAIATQQRVPFLDLSTAPTQTGSATQTAADPAATAIVAVLKSLVPDPLAGFFSPTGNAILAAAPPPPPPPPAPSALQLPAAPPS